MNRVPRRTDILLTAAITVLTLLMFHRDAAEGAWSDGIPHAVGITLAVGACLPIVVWRTRPLVAAVISLPLACVALALGFRVIIPVVMGLALCGWAVIHQGKRITIPLAAFAATVMAAGVGATGDDISVWVRILIGAAIGVVVVLIGHVIRSERERTEETRKLAERIAELRDRDVDRAVVEERLRIARDVHDITGHHLSAISLQAAGAGRSTSDPVAQAAFERIHQLTGEALGRTRHVLGVLRESGPATRTPTPRLEHVDDLLEPARSAGLTVDLRMDAFSSPLPDEIDLCAYRIVQEAMTNVVRHAEATSVRVDIARADGNLVITVTDNGIGKTGVPGGGVRGMQERVGIVGGTVTAQPTDGGWMVHARLPIESRSPRSTPVTPSDRRVMSS